MPGQQRNAHRNAILFAKRQGNLGKPSDTGHGCQGQSAGVVGPSPDIPFNHAAFQRRQSGRRGYAEQVVGS